MIRETGTYRTTSTHGETVRAFLPHPLPPAGPPLLIEGRLAERHAAAVAAIGRLGVAGAMVPEPGWFLYGFVRKEAVLSSQIEGTQATLRDVATFEATSGSDTPADVEEVCNYVEAVNQARAAITDPGGLPLSTRLLCDIHQTLMRGVRGKDKLPGAKTGSAAADRATPCLCRRRPRMCPPPLRRSKAGSTRPTRCPRS